MTKLAILGIDNSHSWHFSRTLAPKVGKNYYDDIELIGVYGDYDTEDGIIARAEIEKNSSCTNFARHYNDFVEDADAVMITAKHGSLHLKYAEEYIKKGIPVWIDKPITCSSKDVCKMIELAKKYNCPLTGGSCLPRLANMRKLIAEIKTLETPVVGGHVTAPVNMVNPYGNFWFYTQHLAQMITSVFGNDVRSVYAIESKNGVNAIYHYDDYSVTAFYGTNYSVSVYINNFEEKVEAFELPEDYYMPSLVDFYDVIKSGKSDMTYKDLAAPVYIIEATIKSITEKKEVEIVVPF